MRIQLCIENLGEGEKHRGLLENCVAEPKGAALVVPKVLGREKKEKRGGDLSSPEEVLRVVLRCGGQSEANQSTPPGQLPSR